MQHGDVQSGLQASKRIRQEVQACTNALRRRHAWLAHQNAIGLTIFLVSALALVANAAAYAHSLVPAWLAVVTAALFMSLLHELEHDLIHRLYFRDQPFVYNLMMLGVWLLRPSTINPWVRRDWHLHHHRVSGTPTDLEERTLSNGEAWGPRRVVMIADSLLGYLVRPRTAKKLLRGYAAAQGDGRARVRALWRNRLSMFPLTAIFYVLWYTFLAQQLLALFGRPVPTTPFKELLDFVAVVLLMPCVLRTTSLNFISSNIHYYGDIEPRNVVQETQVWNARWLWPLQLFCFNFGATHGIHHFVVQEPFYIRQLIASEAHEIMRRHGVRFNDFASLRRANRWGSVQLG